MSFNEFERFFYKKENRIKRILESEDRKEQEISDRDVIFNVQLPQNTCYACSGQSPHR